MKLKSKFEEDLRPTKLIACASFLKELFLCILENSTIKCVRLYIFVVEIYVLWILLVSLFSLKDGLLFWSVKRIRRFSEKRFCWRFVNVFWAVMEVIGVLAKVASI